MKNEDPKEKEIEELRKFIATAEENLESAKKALSKLTGEDISKIKSSFKPSDAQISALNVADGGKIIEGIFDGENMLGPEGKVYPVPANYASKSKLVEGDKLKLTIAEDGSFIFKQIGPVERKKIIGVLSFDDNMFHVSVEGKIYNILYASATYFKAKPGDRVTVVVPANEDSNWAALENVIHEVVNNSEGEKEKNMGQDQPNTNPPSDDMNLGGIQNDHLTDVSESLATDANASVAGSSIQPADAAGTNFTAPPANPAEPQESFLPRDHDEFDGQNALGEALPSEKPADDTSPANELEI